MREPISARRSFGKLKSENGREAAGRQLWLRMANAGVRADVVHALGDLSLTTDEDDTRQEEWKRQEERRNLYLGTGAAGLLAAGGMMAAQEKYRRARLHSACELLDMEGIPDPGLRRIAWLRWGILVLASTAVGSSRRCHISMDHGIGEKPEKILTFDGQRAMFFYRLV